MNIIKFNSIQIEVLKFNLISDSRFMFSCNSFWEVYRCFDNRNIFGLRILSKFLF